jgi:hypothetical protein
MATVLKRQELFVAGGTQVPPTGPPSSRESRDGAL